jgi:hypothetical protein
VALVLTDDAETGSKPNVNFIMVIITGVVCMFCWAIRLFKDIMQPVTFLSTIRRHWAALFVIPLRPRGELEVPSTRGLVMLMGTFTGNAILQVTPAISTFFVRSEVSLHRRFEKWMSDLDKKACIGNARCVHHDLAIQLNSQH